jgi:hypothetical protein
MKIRNGFVSNSSSSSFVVAFPKKPESIEDVYKFMFDGKDGVVCAFDDDDALSRFEVSKNVYKSLEEIGFKEATDEEIASEFSERYYFFDGKFYETRGRYCASNDESFEELREFTKKMDMKKKEIDRLRNEVLRKKGPKAISLNASREERNKYYEELKKFRTEDEEFIELDGKYWELSDEYWKKAEELGEVLAKYDVKNFKDDNEGFIFIVSYSDNNGPIGCTMEHGNIFRNVPHVKISNH